MMRGQQREIGRRLRILINKWRFIHTGKAERSVGRRVGEVSQGHLGPCTLNVTATSLPRIIPWRHLKRMSSFE